MRPTSRYIKIGGLVALFSVFILGSLHSASVDAQYNFQATMAASASAGGGTSLQSCPTLDSSAMMSTPQSTMMATSSASASTARPGFLNVELSAVDNCGVQILQVFNGSSAASVLQPNDVIVAVDCIPLSDMMGGTMATASATTASSMTNCMTSTTMNANGSMPGVMGAMSNPACMNTGVAGGTLRVTTLFFCIIAQYHAGDMVTLTVWRGNQQMNVQVTLDPAPNGTPGATAAATTGATGGGSTSSSSGSSATSAATAPSLTTPTAVGTASGGATMAATP